MDMRDIPGLLPRLEGLKNAIEQRGGKPISVDDDLAIAGTAALSPEHADKLDELTGMGSDFLSRAEHAVEAIENFIPQVSVEIDGLRADLKAVFDDVSGIKGQLEDATASFNRLSEQLEALKAPAASASTEQPQG